MSDDIYDVTIVSESMEPVCENAEAMESYLVMIYGEYLGRRYSIAQEEVLIGRSPDCKILLVDDCVSRNHCRLIRGNTGVVIADLESTNGTYINGTAVSARPLRDGDRVKVGRTIFKFLSSDNIEHAYHEEIYRLKTTDGLTGAFNKRYFEEALEREVHRFLRYLRPLSLIMIDIDFFKLINDDYGHLAGDRVLSQLAALISENLRIEDSFCRYGGEEFAVLMPETPYEDAIKSAESLRKLIENACFEFDGIELKATISLGVAEADESMSTPGQFVKIADEYLYRAKQEGRNRVVHKELNVKQAADSE